MTTTLFSRLFGYDPAQLQAQTTASRQKVVTLGTLLLIPVTLWFISVFYLSHVLIGASLIASTVTATIVAGFIFIIDRSFITSSYASSLMVGVRIGFALISSFLGSISLDLMVFGGDIEEYRKVSKGEAEEVTYREFISLHGQEVERLGEEMSLARSRYDHLHVAYLTELDGSAGTGRYGKGAVAKAKEQEMERAYALWEDLQKAYKTEQIKLESDAKSFVSGKISREKGALLSQIHDLHDFVFQDYLTAGIYLLFLALILLLETFILFYKRHTSKSLFEEQLLTEESYGKEKLIRMLERKQEMLKHSGLLHAKVERTEALMRQPMKKAV